MHVVVVHPEEERLAAALAQPREGTIGHRVAGTPRHLEEQPVALGFHLAVIEAEPAVETEARVEHEGGDHGCCVVAVGREALGHGQDRGRHDEAAVVVHPVLLGVEPGQDRGVAPA